MQREISMVILAGGHSSRMGKDKADLKIQGKTFLEYQIEKGRELGISNILVSGYRGENCSAAVIQDRYEDKGPLAGLEACLRKADESCCLVLSVDVPLVPMKELQKLLDAYEQSEKEIVILKNNDREQPLIGVYAAALADEMQREFLERKGSVFAFINRVGYAVYESKENPDCFVNINSPEQYQRYCVK